MRPRRSGASRVQIDAGGSLIAGSKPTRQGRQRFEPDSRRFARFRQFMSGVINGISSEPLTFLLLNLINRFPIAK